MMTLTRRTVGLGMLTAAVILGVGSGLAFAQNRPFAVTSTGTATLTGRIVYPNGAPAAGATIGFRASGSFSFENSIVRTADHNGAFAAGPLRNGTSYQVVAFTPIQRSPAGGFITYQFDKTLSVKPEVVGRQGLGLVRLGAIVLGPHEEERLRRIEYTRAGLMGGRTLEQHEVSAAQAYRRPAPAPIYQEVRPDGCYYESYGTGWQRRGCYSMYNNLVYYQGSAFGLPQGENLYVFNRGWLIQTNRGWVRLEEYRQSPTVTDQILTDKILTESSPLTQQSLRQVIIQMDRGASAWVR